MRKYLFGTGIIGAVTGGIALLKELRDEEPFTWRTALAWLSWGISLTLAIGAIVDTRRASQGRPVAGDSPAVERQREELRKRLKR